MFTFQKLALVAAAGFAAFAMSCSDDDGDDPKPINLPSGFAQTGQVQLGGGTSAVGSFLDIDAIKVYKQSEAAGKKNDIDLFFDGTNFKTPDGAPSTGLGSELAGSTSEARFCVVPSTKTLSTVDDVVDFFMDCDALVAAPVIANRAYIFYTSDDKLALVKVDGEVGATIDLGVAVVTIEWDNQEKPITLPPGFDRTETIVLGGIASTIGSFLDIDANPLKVYKQSEAAAKKNDIDLFFEGTNFKTPDGAPSTGLGSELAGSTSVAAFCVVPSSVTISSVTDMVDFFWDCNEVIAAPVIKNGAYIFYTSDDKLALVIVDGEVGTTVTLRVGVVTIDWDNL